MSSFGKTYFHRLVFLIFLALLIPLVPISAQITTSTDSNGDKNVTHIDGVKSKQSSGYYIQRDSTDDSWSFMWSRKADTDAYRIFDDNGLDSAKNISVASRSKICYHVGDKYDIRSLGPVIWNTEIISHTIGGIIYLKHDLDTDVLLYAYPASSTELTDRSITVSPYRPFRQFIDNGILGRSVSDVDITAMVYPISNGDYGTVPGTLPGGRLYTVQRTSKGEGDLYDIALHKVNPEQTSFPIPFKTYGDNVYYARIHIGIDHPFTTSDVECHGAIRVSKDASSPILGDSGMVVGTPKYRSVTQPSGDEQLNIGSDLVLRIGFSDNIGEITAGDGGGLEIADFNIDGAPFDDSALELESITRTTISGVTHHNLYDLSFTVEDGREVNGGDLIIKKGLISNYNGEASENDLDLKFVFNVDTLAPTVELSLDHSVINTFVEGGTTTLRIDFSEPIFDFTADDIFKSSGVSLGTFRGSSGFKSYSVVVTAGVKGDYEVGVLVHSTNPGIDKAANKIPASKIDLEVVEGLQARITNNRSTLTVANKTANLEIDFTQQLSTTNGFATGDLGSTDGKGSYKNLSTPSSGADARKKYTFDFEANDNIEDSAYKIQLPAGVVENTAATPIENEVSNEISINIDTKKPTVEFTPGVTALKKGEITSFTIKFHESVSGFTRDDISPTNGTLGVLNGSGANYSIVFTPTDEFEGSGGISLISARVTDAVGNTNEAASRTDIAIDTKPPKFNILGVVSTSMENIAYARAGQKLRFSLALNEADTWKATNDITFNIGTGVNKNSDDIAALNSSGDEITDTSSPISSSTYEYTVVGGVNGDNGTLTVRSLNYQDAPSNTIANFPTGFAFTSNVTVDTIDPDASIDLKADSDTGESNSDNETSDTTPTFPFVCDAVDANIDEIKVYYYPTSGAIADKILVGENDCSVGGTIDITVAEGSELDDGSYYFYATAEDKAGNTSDDTVAGIEGRRLEVIIDTTPPKVISLVIDDELVKIGDVPTLTLEASEDLWLAELDGSDIGYVEGKGVGAGTFTKTTTEAVTTTYTFDFTPEDNISKNDVQHNVEIGIPAGSFKDVAGNDSVAADPVVTESYRVDTVSPQFEYLIFGDPAAYGADSAGERVSEYLSDTEITATSPRKEYYKAGEIVEVHLKLEQADTWKDGATIMFEFNDSVLGIRTATSFGPRTGTYGVIDGYSEGQAETDLQTQEYTVVGPVNLGDDDGDNGKIQVVSTSSLVMSDYVENDIVYDTGETLAGFANIEAIVDTIPPVPQKLDLVATSDSGYDDRDEFSSDDLTNDTTPTFTVSSLDTNAGKFDVYYTSGGAGLGDDVLIGKDINFDESKNGTFTVGGDNSEIESLEDGVYEFYIIEEDLAGNVSLETDISTTSNKLRVEIDATPPVVPVFTVLKDGDKVYDGRGEIKIVGEDSQRALGEVFRVSYVCADDGKIIRIRGQVNASDNTSVSLGGDGVFRHDDCENTDASTREIDVTLLSPDAGGPDHGAEFTLELENYDLAGNKGSYNGDLKKSDAETIADNNPLGTDIDGNGIRDFDESDIVTFYNVTKDHPLDRRGGLQYNTIEVKNMTAVARVPEFEVAGNFESKKLYEEPNYSYPEGYLGFEVVDLEDGDEIGVRMYMDRLYESDLIQELSLAYYNRATESYRIFGGEVVFGSAKFTVGGEEVSVTTLDYKIRDGGEYDEDGLADGKILDPVGPTYIILKRGGSGHVCKLTETVEVGKKEGYLEFDFGNIQADSNWDRDLEGSLSDSLVAEVGGNLIAASSMQARREGNRIIVAVEDALITEAGQPVDIQIKNKVESGEACQYNYHEVVGEVERKETIEKVVRIARSEPPGIEFWGRRTEDKKDVFEGVIEVLTEVVQKEKPKCDIVQYNRNPEAVGEGIDENLFTDVDENHQAYQALLALAEQGIVEGDKDKGYARLDDDVLRAEVVKLMTVAREDRIAKGGCSEVDFDDVDRDAWYYDYVGNMSKKEIVEGYDDGSFRPEDSINKVEMFKIVMLSFGYEPFPRQEGEKWYTGYLKKIESLDLEPEWLKDQGVQDVMTRGDFFAFLWNMLQEVDSK